jgi:hypothetical protein
MDSKKLMGFENPGDKKVPVSVRDWNGMKLAAWRAFVGFRRTERAALAILDGCEHEEGCPGIESEAEPCFANCRDRERRMDALLILNSARMYSPLDARKPADDPYFAPSRELFSETLATLGATQLELDALRAVVRQAGLTVDPPVNTPQQLEESTSP